jgi:type II secretory pathway pseudopilin PulG
VKRLCGPGGARLDAGYSMPALLAMLAIMTLALMLAMPSWRYLVHDDKEQELIFRGRQISAAIARFQRKNGNAFPASLEQLVQGKYLRKAYADPLVADGKWRVLRPGEVGPVRPGPGAGGGGIRPSPSPSPSPSPVGRPAGGSSGLPAGPIAGVVSLSTEKALRSANGSQDYSRWVFAPNVPFVIGGQGPGALLPPGRPGVQGPAGSAQGSVRSPDAGAARISR